MKTKNYIYAVLVSCLFSGAVYAQDEAIPAGTEQIVPAEPKENEEMVTHKIMMGETVMLIAKKYKVKPTDIYEYNPDATQGIAANGVLQIPMHRKYKKKSKPVADAVEDTAHKTN